MACMLLCGLLLSCAGFEAFNLLAFSVPMVLRTRSHLFTQTVFVKTAGALYKMPFLEARKQSAISPVCGWRSGGL